MVESVVARLVHSNWPVECSANIFDRQKKIGRELLPGRPMEKETAYCDCKGR